LVRECLFRRWLFDARHGGSLDDGLAEFLSHARDPPASPNRRADRFTSLRRGDRPERRQQPAGAVRLRVGVDRSDLSSWLTAVTCGGTTGRLHRNSTTSRRRSPNSNRPTMLCSRPNFCANWRCVTSAFLRIATDTSLSCFLEFVETRGKALTILPASFYWSFYWRSPFVSIIIGYMSWSFIR